MSFCSTETATKTGYGMIFEAQKERISRKKKHWHGYNKKWKPINFKSFFPHKISRHYHIHLYIIHFQWQFTWFSRFKMECKQFVSDRLLLLCEWIIEVATQWTSSTDKLDGLLSLLVWLNWLVYFWHSSCHSNCEFVFILPMTFHIVIYNFCST